MDGTAGIGRSQRVLVTGATGTIGRATVRALVAAGHDVVCLVRARPGTGAPPTPRDDALAGAEVRVGDATSLASISRDGVRGEAFDAIVSCLASRTGAPADAWAVDHDANMQALHVARTEGIGRFVLLSALCVQTPRLEFQRAKLAFEKALVASGLGYSIVRPTAFFKSLSGQVDRVRRGRPFLVFGDGRRTSCKPISDDDLGRFLAGCLTERARHDRVLPVGGPGPAITPRDQGEMLFALLGRPPRFRQVPFAAIDAVAAALGAAARIAPGLADKAEFARIGRYYAKESMLVRDPRTGRHDADATPSFGTETLRDHYARIIAGERVAGLGDHAVF